MSIIERLEDFCADINVNDINDYVIKNQNKFNIFKVLKLDNHEIRHSNFLAWLLNPKENHNLQGNFLQKFLQQAINFNICDVDDLIVQTEYYTNKARRIDILLHSKKSDFVCVIENKYGSNEHDEQCQHYKDFIENYSRFKEYQHKYYIFLDIEKPDNELLKKALNCYEPITYREVYNILEAITKSQNDIQENVLQTIEQYKSIIMEKYLMLDNVTKSKCKEVFGKYYDVIKTLEQYKSEFQQDMYGLMLKILDDRTFGVANADIKGVGYNDKTGCGIRFIPVEYSENANILKPNRLTKFSIFFSLEYKNELKLGIYQIKPNEQWIEYDYVKWDVIDKSEEEIKESIISKIAKLKIEYETIVKNS